jgi:hypothetical protein
MPYIKQNDRQHLDEALVRRARLLITNEDLSPGDLNYIISTIIWKSFEKQMNYSKANELVGVLECVKQEFYRRQVVPYEEEKIGENGDLL